MGIVTETPAVPKQQSSALGRRILHIQNTSRSPVTPSRLLKTILTYVRSEHTSYIEIPNHKIFPHHESPPVSIKQKSLYKKFSTVK